MAPVHAPAVHQHAVQLEPAQLQALAECRLQDKASELRLGVSAGKSLLWS